MFKTKITGIKDPYRISKLKPLLKHIIELFFSEEYDLLLELIDTMILAEINQDRIYLLMLVKSQVLMAAHQYEKAMSILKEIINVIDTKGKDVCRRTLTLCNEYMAVRE